MYAKIQLYGRSSQFTKWQILLYTDTRCRRPAGTCHPPFCRRDSTSTKAARRAARRFLKKYMPNVKERE